MTSSPLQPATLHWARWDFSDAARAVEFLAQTAPALAPLSGPCWIVQGFAALDFLAGPAPRAAIAASFAGRAFSPHGELRWLAGGSLWQVWAFTEDSPRLLAAIANAPFPRQDSCRCRDIPHVLWGLSDPARRLFDEPQMGRARSYPAAAASPEHRAAILVREYLPLPVTSASDPDLPQALARLNAPEVAAHRFLSLLTGATGAWIPAPAQGASK